MIAATRAPQMQVCEVPRGSTFTSTRPALSALYESIGVSISYSDGVLPCADNAGNALPRSCSGEGFQSQSHRFPTYNSLRRRESHSGQM